MSVQKLEHGPAHDPGLVIARWVTSLLKQKHAHAQLLLQNIEHGCVYTILVKLVSNYLSVFM